MTPSRVPPPVVYPELVRARVAAGWTEADAMATPPTPRARHSVSEVRAACENSASARELAKSLGISVRHARMVRSGTRWKAV